MNIKFLYSKNPENSLMTRQEYIILKCVDFEQEFQNLNPVKNVVKGEKNS